MELADFDTKQDISVVGNKAHFLAFRTCFQHIIDFLFQYFAIFPFTA